jgi:Trypsin-like serine proteases, typically periplasmic, contain C-terminal PDZ domain
MIFMDIYDNDDKNQTENTSDAGDTAAAADKADGQDTGDAPVSESTPDMASEAAIAGDAPKDSDNRDAVNPQGTGDIPTIPVPATGQYYNSKREEPHMYTVRKKSNFKSYLAAALITSIISSSAVGGVLYKSFSAKLSEQEALVKKLALSTSTTGTSQPSATNVSYTPSSNGTYSVSDIAKKISPSIVGIRMTVTNSRSNFFGNGGSQSNEGSGEGSGIIISKDGYIMTNYHVVEYADPKQGASANTILEVFLPDKRQAKAKFIGGDEANDLAVIKIDLSDLPVAELGDSTQLQVGEPVVAIGNPLGMEFAGSVTSGVVSALNREVQIDDRTMTLVQTDAAINPGNSGGALVNSKGQVIGINSVKIQETGVEGLGFAIPISDAKPVVDQLMQYGYVKDRPLLGISGQVVTDALSQYYNLPVGIYVSDVSAGGGAEKAGIKKGDVLISLAGRDIKSMADLDAVKKAHKAGDTVDAVISRNGNKINLKITFTEDKGN